MEHLKYPIGRFEPSNTYSMDMLTEKINDLKILPKDLTLLVEGLNKIDLIKTYRDGSWNIKQLIHHLGESHLNCYMRLKLALTEDTPTIKPYAEDLWVKTIENEKLDISVSLALIENIHLKLTTLLESLTNDQFDRTFFHPQYQRTFRISDLLALYSWHGKHHLAHIHLALKV